MSTLAVAGDLLLQALRRKWFLALGLIMTAGLALLGLSLRMDVVDGAFAGMRLFGAVVQRDIQAADVAVRPIFKVLAYVIFYGSTVFLVLGCSDFAPRLLAPGRIEHLLSLPIRRFELIAGTYLGVLGLGALVVLYGAGGLVVILGFKAGVWTVMPILAALLGLLAFATIYAAMLATAIVVRSSALSTAVGGVLFIAGLVAGKRDSLLPIWERGIGRTIFATITLFVPRVSALGNACAGLASAERLAPGALISLLVGFLLFAGGGLALAIWLFERRDF